MYAITKLSQESQAFLNHLSMSGKAQSLHSSIAIAKALSNSLPVPSSEVDNIEMHYRSTHLLSVQKQLSDLNELIVVDTATILLYTQRFYQLRYQQVVPNKTICCLKSETAVQDFFGLTSFIDEATLAAIAVKPMEITKIHNGAVVFFCEIAQAEY